MKSSKNHRRNRRSSRHVELLEERQLLAVPAAASEVVAKMASTQAINVTWKDNSNNEVGFRIERNADINEAPGAWLTCGFIGANATSFTDQGLTSGQAYSYRVIPYNADGSGATSEGTIEPFRTYRAATRITHTLNRIYQAEDSQAATGTHNGLFWQAYLDEGDTFMYTGIDTSNLTGVTFSMGSATGTGSIDIRADSAAGTLLGTLTPFNTGGIFNWAQQTAATNTLAGTHDLFMICHGSTIGNIDWVRFNGDADAPPSGAYYVVANAGTGTNVDVVWQDFSDSETGFKIERNLSPDEASGSWVQAGTVGANVTSFTDTGALAGVTYSYRVIAFNAAGNGPSSEGGGEPFRTYRATPRVQHFANAAIQGEAYQTQKGIHNSLNVLSWTDEGDYVSYSNVDLTNAATFFCRIATLVNGGHVEVHLDSPTGTKIADLVTASTGDYFAFKTQSAPVTGGSGLHDIYLTFAGGGGIGNIDYFNFGTAGAASITGNVFNDTNSNGARNGSETGIASWVLYLDADNDNVKDAGEPGTTTDAGGRYTFSSLAAGKYTVKQQLQSGYRKTLPGQGIAGYVDVEIGAGEAHASVDFADTKNILLAGVAFNDVNSNGMKDAGEGAIIGATIQIISNAIVVATRVTDGTGAWRVQGLAAGTGSAKIILPNGYTATSPVGGIYNGTMSAGQANQNLNFGLHGSPTAPPPAFSGATILAGADTDASDGVLN